MWRNGLLQSWRRLRRIYICIITTQHFVGINPNTPIKYFRQGYFVEVPSSANRMEQVQLEFLSGMENAVTLENLGGQQMAG